jgi:hypothetical protein
MEFDEFDRHDENEDHLRALELRMAGWRPAAGALDRDRMLYDAGRSRATADTRIQAWRLATAALLCLSIGLSGLLGHQASKLARERILLAHEQAQRRQVEQSVTIVASGVPAEPSRQPVESAPAEPFAPASYFVLTSQLVSSGPGASWPEAEGADGSSRRDPRRLEKRPGSAPLRSRDVQRVFEL